MIKSNIINIVVAQAAVGTQENPYNVANGWQGSGWYLKGTISATNQPQVIDTETQFNDIYNPPATTSGNTEATYWPLLQGWKGPGWYKAWYMSSPVYISNINQYNSYPS